MLRWRTDRPALERPILFVALEGFVDAGSVASSAAMFLRHRWTSETVATFDGDALVDYRARRPTAVVDAGRLRRVEWPTIELCAADLEGQHDALLLLGPEPDFAWRTFVDEVRDLCDVLGVEQMIGLGAYPAAVPHTRPVSIVQASADDARALAFDVPAVAGYTGPVGVSVALQESLGRAGIPATGLWVEVPHYIAASPYPQGALSLVELLAATLGLDVDTTELQAAATIHREQVDEAIRQHPDAAGLVAALEAHVDDESRSVELPSGEDLAAEIERFLRTQQDG